MKINGVTMVSAAECLEALGAVCSLELVLPHWEESQAALAKDGIFFLRRESWLANRALCGFGDEYDQRFARVAELIEGNEALRRFVWHTYWRAFKSPTVLAATWPEFDLLAEDGGVPNLLVALSWAALLREHHRQLNIPEENTLETLPQVRHFCEENYRRAFKGRLGIFPGQLCWLKQYLKKVYLRIGRLEYCLQASSDPVLAYRHCGDGRVVALVEAEIQFTKNGYRLGSPEEYEQEQGGWLSKLEFSSDCVHGHPILPEGRVSRQVLTLPLNEWKLVFSRGDNCLQMHIPPGGKMTLESCGESLKRARAFFKAHFPRHDIRAVSCGSWIFNPELEEIMPAGANLLAFQRELYLYPLANGPWDGLWFIFLKGGAPDDSFPRETELQRRILDFIETGRRWRCGGMFILNDDIGHFSTQFYRKNFPEL